MQRHWLQTGNISQTTHAHFRLRRSLVGGGMSAERGFAGLDYSLSDCFKNQPENISAGLPTATNHKQLKI